MRELLSALRKNNIHLELTGGDLSVRFPKGQTNKILLEEIRRNKTGLINYLAKLNQYEYVPIPLCKDDASFVLSSSQHRLWVLSRLEESNIAYNIPAIYRLEGNLDIKALIYSFNQLIGRYEILRTTFKENADGNVHQFIKGAEELNFSIDCRDLRGEETQEIQVEEIIRETVNLPFDLATGPLVRATLLQLADTKWVFAYVVHHIISDGWSMGILIKELRFHYNAYSAGLEHLSTPPRIQYKDYAAWQQEQLQNDQFRLHKDYWLKQLSGELPVLELAADKVRPSVKTYNGGIIHRTINREISKAIKAIGHEQGATLFMSLLAVVNVLLYKHTGEEDIIIGSPIAGREHADLEEQLGLYLNTLALRSGFSGEDSYKKLLEKVKQVTLEGYEHQAYPFDELINELRLQHDRSRHPLFDVIMVLQNTQGQTGIVEHLGEASISEYEGEHVISKFDLSFNFIEADETIRLSIEYNSDIFIESAIERLGVQLEQLMLAIAQQPLLPLRSLNYLSIAERHRVLIEFNDTVTNYPRQTISHLFEEQVKRTPGHIALVAEDTRLTYNQLNERANQLAGFLRSRYRIRPDDLVGIQLDRGEWMIISMLAVLKAGGAYVPIDPEYPQERINYIISDSNCKAVIDEEELLKFHKEQKQHKKSNLKSVNKPHDLAYVMYTSGSTGKPKGVLVEQASVVRLVRNTNYISPCANDCMLSLSNFAFDGFTFDIYAAILNGGRLALRNKELFMDIKALDAFIRDNKVTTFFIPVALLNTLADSDLVDLSQVQKIFFGGELPSVGHIRKFKEKYKTVDFIHVYGPTENTTFSTFYKTGVIKAEDKTIPIGMPISNTQVYIIDNCDPMSLVPVGVIGEICLGGDGLARGYLNKPELTAEKFVPNPFVRGERMYKTGDLGRWLPGGIVECVGRRDDQVKVRGFRIELGEIENTLQNHPLIDRAVVVTQTGANNEKYLVAYVVSHQSIDSLAIRSYLAQVLPAYMVPAYFIQLASLPLTSNGKVNKKALPEPDASMLLADTTGIAPRTPKEIKLAMIWSEVLGIAQEKIGIKDNFFELGGYSLKITRLASQIHKMFEVKIALRDFFDHPTIEGQAMLIRETGYTSFATIPPAPERSYYPLSAAQRRLWVLSQFEEGNIAYNIPAAYVFEGELDEAALVYSFNILIDRHENLRTIFRQDQQGGVSQVILAAGEIKFSIGGRDLRKEEDAAQKLKECVQREFITAFDLSTGPLLRANLYRVDNKQWVFSCVMHHIISDGWSMEVLVKELLLLYNAHIAGSSNPLPALRIQYKDYVCWQQEQLSVSALAAHKAYWLTQFKGTLPVLELPTSKQRPAVKTFNGAVINRNIGKEITNGIKRISREQDATLFMAMLGAIHAFFFRYTQQEDIIIGTPMSGREHADLHDQVGFYANTLALRLSCKGGENYNEIIANAKRVTLEAYEHQSYPFNELVEQLHIQRDASRNPLFDVQVIVNDKTVPDQSGELKISEYKEAAIQRSVFDMVFTFVETDQGLQSSITYNTDIYSRELVDQLGIHLESLLSAIISNPGLAVNQLEFLTATEKQQLLTSFNDTAVAYPANKTLVNLFEEQVLKTPGAIAVVSGEEEFTYKQLDARSNQLANYLRANYRVQADDLIGLMADRSASMLVAMLGILKAGAGYVPIDPSYPRARKEFIVKDTGIEILLTQTGYLFDLDYYEGNIFAIDVQLDTIDTSAAPCDAVIRSTDLAYVIYTSGSTGEPKGVMIEHGAIVNTVYGQQELFNARQGDKNLQFASLSFDASVSEIFVSLASGGSLYIIGEEEKQSPELLEQYIATHQIGIATIPPAYLKLLQIQNLQSLKTLITAGEAARAEDANRFLPYGDYLNAYGPTESSICATTYKVKKGGQVLAASVPIGIPIPNALIYITDSHSNLVPPGVNGEICIGGAGLARGYLNRPELSAEKFVSNPFREGERMYRTGDLGRWLPDGNIEFTGRKDDQVKIRGYRIELGEIESVLHHYPGMESAVVIARPDAGGDKILIAYLVSASSLNIAALRSYLSSHLPSYMLPSHFIQLEVLPVNTSGKIDRKALPDPEGAGMETGVGYVAPRNKIEEHLIAVYEEVLKKNAVGIRDDFFVLGGDSIKSIQVVSRLKQRGYSLTIQDVLLHPVIEELSACIKTASRFVEQESVKGIIPLSPVQQFFFRQYPINNHHYNQSVLLYSKAIIAEQALQEALDHLVLHHDMLRTIFYEGPAGWVQEIKEASSGYPLEIMRIAEAGSFEEHCERIQSGVDLVSGPLFKAALFHGDDSDRLLLVAHHLIIDGVSWRILFEDLSALYQQAMAGEPLSLPLKTDSFRYYQERQLEYAAGEDIQKEEPYWHGIESGTFSSLPVDHSQGSNLAKDVATCSFVLDENITGRLLTKCYKAYRTGINDILLTGLSLAAGQAFGLDKIMISLEGHGRESIGSDTDITRTIGWFTTTYPVVFDMRYGDDMLRQLVEVKESLHRVPNKGIGYGGLRYLQGRDYKLNPEISFNYLGDFGSGIDTVGGKSLFEFADVYHGKKMADDMRRTNILDVSGMLVNGQLNIAISYSKEQYDRATIEKLAASCQQLLIQLIDRLSTEEQTFLTPVDLTYKHLDTEQVSQLNKEYNIEDIYPLGPLQEGLYYHWLGAPSSPAYFMQVSCRLKGSLDITILEKSCQALVARHSVLRTSFTEDIGPRSLQIVQKDRAAAFSYVNAVNDPGFFIEEYKAADRAKGFDLHKGALMRLAVLDLGNDVYEFIWSHHHIIMDGWCGSVLIKEFFQIYYSLTRNEAPGLPKAYPYSAYIGWLEKIDRNKSLLYWKDYLAGYDTISTIPAIVANRKPVYKALKKIFRLDDSTVTSMKKYCSELGVTENTFIQSVWGILLAKYNNSTDVVFGSVVSGRPAELEGVEEMIGLFSNTIPVRITLKEGMTSSGILKKVQAQSIEAASHHYIQLAEVLAQSTLGRNLFDHLMVFENFPVQEIMKQGMEGEGEAISFLSSSFFDQTNYEFTLTIRPGEVFEIKFDCNGNIYTEEQIDSLQDHFLRIIEQVLEKADIPVAEINCLSEKERNQLLISFNETGILFPADKTLVNLFEVQALKTPGAIAVVSGEEEFTYKQLDARSNQLANYLRANYRVQADDLIGLMADRSASMLVALLGILKAGAGYVPIDPSYPRVRKEFIVNDTGIEILLTQTGYLFDLDYYEGNIFAIDVQLDTIDTSAAPCDAVIRSKDLAYVIYTSGSTGEPKGVMIEHGAIVNTVYGQQELFNARQGDKNLQFASLSFDASVSEIFVSLASGGSLYIIGEEEKQSPELLEQYIATHQIGIATIPPAYLKLLQIQNLQSLKTLVTAGEAARAEDANRFLPYGDYLNAYGPTESSICATTYKIKKGGQVPSASVPIGIPIPNAVIYITDSHSNLVPPGVNGEICIGGSGLARGYLNRPELSAEKFVSNPFREGERMYRTGDLGRWLPDGNIEFTGRKDDQVKIRGYRIELGEIESVLHHYPGMESAVVIARPDAGGDKILIAYLVSTSSLNIAELRSWLSSHLPSYMLPSHFVQMEALPVNTSGKIDRKALPDPEGAGMETGVGYVAPANETEEKLILVWSEVLGIAKDKIGIRDNFFDLGGHSLKATRLVTHIHKEFDTRIALQDVFAHVTPEEQALLIIQAKKSTFAAISPVELQPDYALSSSQRRLWVLSQFAEGVRGYNAPGAYVFEGELDTTVLADSFLTLIERHESLRTVFREKENGEIRQLIWSVAETGFALGYQDLRGETEELLNELVQEEFTRAFDLSAGPLVRASLFQVADTKWVLVYVMHHIISDGWSMEVLVKELLQVYNAYRSGHVNPLMPLPVQYKDYAAWQQQQLSGELLEEHKAYWLQQLAGELPVLELPTDKMRPALKTYNGASVKRVFNKHVSKGIKEIGRVQGSTLFMSLVAVVDTFLYRYTGQNDMIIGTTIAGREHADLEEQIGFYVNTLALRTKFTGKNSYCELLENTKQVALNAFAHQVYPFDELVNDLHPERDISRHPLFDVLIELQSTAMVGKEQPVLQGVRVEQFENNEGGIGKFDLRFMFSEAGEELEVMLEYNTDLYNRETMERWTKHLEELITAIVSEPGKAIDQLEYISREEKDQLLSFNEIPVNKEGYRGVLNLFSEQVLATPGAPAISFRNITLSYAELDERASRLAAHLRSAYGIQPGSLVGIMMDRSEKMIIGLLGILKAGAAYVPIDPLYPSNRKEFILKDTGIQVLLTQTDYVFDLDYYQGNVFAMDVQSDGLEQENDLPGIAAGPDHLAYVIYTSGSTGQPKGCCLTHGNLSNYIQWALDYYFQGKAKANFGLYTSLSFDLTVTSVFCSLAMGSRLWIYDQHEELQNILKHSFTGNSGIDSIKLTPSHIHILRHMDLYSSTMHCAIVGGEEVTLEQVSILRRINPAIRIYNEYGPTEATVGCIVGELQENKPVLIGRPIAGTAIYIIDKERNLCPVGIPGEICISGLGLAPGYFNKPALTAEKFISNPFRAGERMYRTGDLGRWLTDGTIKFIGREDDQVKIRGYRIEPGEIENVLQAHPGISSVAVIVRTNAGNEKYLAAYITGPEAIDLATIRSYLSDLLPAYMIPDHFIQLETLPLTINGKVDRKALPDPVGSMMGADTEYVAPRNEMEEKLVLIWQEILNKERIGIRDNFFSLGGHSVKAIQLLARINKDFDMDHSLDRLFQHPTIEDIATEIEKTNWVNTDLVEIHNTGVTENFLI